MIQTFFLLLSKFSLSRLFNSFCLRISYGASVVLKRRIFCGVPEAISYELSSVCNLHCPECPAGRNRIRRNRSFPDKKVYVDFLEAVADRLWYILLYFQGEPFMNPDWYYFVSEAAKRRIYTAISTNGHFLNEKNIMQILDSGLDEIIISVDGVTQEEYEKYRKGGDWETVITGIQNLVNAKRRRKSIRPLVTLQFIVFSHNENSVSAFRKMARKLGADRVQVKTAQLEDLSHVSLLPHGTKFRRYKIVDGKAVLKKKPKNRCWRVWHSLVITSDANVVPCCFDKHAEHVLGNLSTGVWENVRKNKPYKVFVNQVFTNRLAIRICQNCTE